MIRKEIYYSKLNEIKKDSKLPNFYSSRNKSLKKLFPQGLFYTRNTDEFFKYNLYDENYETKQKSFLNKSAQKNNNNTIIDICNSQSKSKNKAFVDSSRKPSEGLNDRNKAYQEGISNSFSNLKANMQEQSFQINLNKMNSNYNQRVDGSTNKECSVSPKGIVDIKKDFEFKKKIVMEYINNQR